MDAETVAILDDLEMGEIIVLTGFDGEDHFQYHGKFGGFRKRPKGPWRDILIGRRPVLCHQVRTIRRIEIYGEVE